MPTTRRRIHRSPTRLGAIAEVAWKLCTDEPVSRAEFASSWDAFVLQAPDDGEPEAREGSLRWFWEANRDAVLREWIAAHPGTRPSCWCRWDAPEPRRRLGGIGTPKHEALAYAPSFYLGIPTLWVTADEVAYYNGRARDIFGSPIATEYRDGHFPYTAIDPSDPPSFESQAAFLDRHGLLTPAERKRLTAADFEPELVELDDVDED